MTKKQKTTAAWTVVAIAFIGGLALTCVQNKTAPVLDVIMADFCIGETDAGWLTSLFTIMGMITAIPTSALMRKFGAKNLAVFALVCAAAGSVLGAFTEGNLGLMLATRAIEGIGAGMIAVVGPTIVSEWFPAEKRSLPVSLSWATPMTVSQTVMFFVGAGLATNFGWQGVWWFGAIFAVIAIVLYLWKFRGPDGSEEEPNYAIGEDDEEFHFGEGFKSASTWLITIGGLLYTFCSFGFATYISLYWAETFYGGDMGISNMYVAILYGIEIPMFILAGWFFDKIKPGKRHWFGVISFLLYGIMLFVSFRLSNPAFLIPCMIAYPLTECICGTSIWCMVASTAKKPENCATAIGILNIGLNAGTLLGPPAIGFFIEHYGWSAAALPLAVVSVVGAVAFVFVKQYKLDGTLEK